jgi:hypothetical protein
MSYVAAGWLAVAFASVVLLYKAAAETTPLHCLMCAVCRVLLLLLLLLLLPALASGGLRWTCILACCWT